jgi:hypothetical protein
VASCQYRRWLELASGGRQRRISIQMCIYHEVYGTLDHQPVDQMFWDNTKHLYAISRSAGKLFVYTVTSTGVKAAPGSPHAIAKPQNIIVLPK